MAEPRGLLTTFLERLQGLGISSMPQLKDKWMTIEITEQDFYNATTRNLRPEQREAIRIKFVEGKIIISIKVF